MNRNIQAVIALAVAAILLASCKSAIPTASMESVMSMEEARKIAADFKIAKYIAPPRTIDNLRSKFKEGIALPLFCKEEWARRQANIDSAQKNLQVAEGQETIPRAANLVVLSEKLISTGRFDEAISNIEKAYDSVPDKNYEVRKAVFATQLARLNARIGNLAEAEEYLAISFGWWAKTEETRIAANRGTWLNKPIGRLFTNSGLAAVARLRGELPLAEYYYREAIRNMGVQDNYYHINKNKLRADLALTVMQQRRLTEAEAEAREAIELLDIKSPSGLNYNGNGAAPVAALAAVLLEQGKVGDAEYLARIAVNMHESSCSEPQSLGITEARGIWIDALAEQGKWAEILVQVRQARLALENYQALFKRLYGTSLAYIEAEIYAGSAGLGHELAKRLKRDLLEEYDQESYQYAEIEGILALVEAEKLQLYRSALNRFSRIIPTLVSQTNLKETIAYSRRQRILQGYMDLLVKLVNFENYQTVNIDIPGELLRVASVLHLGRVAQAASAGTVRAAAGDPELANLVRQEQDLAEEARALGDTLAYVQSAPSVDSRFPHIDDLQARLNAIGRARNRLNEEILINFPEYAELISPKPLTVDQIRKLLPSGQALLVFHVGEDSTYVWAISSDGELAFAPIDISRDNLRKKVARLRQAVDPGVLNSLEDIPVFDVGLAYELFASLLEPVQSGWQDATEVLVVADGPLGALPFSMLVTEPEMPDLDRVILFDRYRSVSWLANELAVTLLPSINTLKNISGKQSKQDARRRPFAGFGDPLFSTQQVGGNSMQVASRGFSLRAAPRTRAVDSADLALLPPLPDTRDEILAIAAAVGADPDQDLYLGKAASEQAVKTTDLTVYDVISFATHGLVPGDLNGLNEPALALSSPVVTDNSEDGLLTMNEILGLRFDADLVVLSACNTAAADGRGAEAVSGLGRAFFYAGSKALLVSNWPVHSDATSDLMIHMFTHLANDRSLSRSEALRQAKLAQIDNGGFKVDGAMAFSYAHPIFWAPFSLVGDPG